MTIRDLTPADVDGLAAFFGALPEEDLTFIREDVHDRAVIAQVPHTPDPRWIAVDGPAITGYAAVEQLPGWSDHSANCAWSSTEPGAAPGSAGR